MASFFAAHVRLSHPPKGSMNSLEVLKTLLTMTTEAEKLASDFEKSDRLRILLIDIRRKAKEENDRLRQDQGQIETRYQLCMIGILEECNFGRASWQSMVGVDSKLGRIHEEIVRTIKEIKANRLIM
jgi:hypothetical protein